MGLVDAVISVITPTGDRPEAFALCEKWVAHQDFLKSNVQWEWLVADDGQVPMTCTMGQIKVPVSVSNSLVSTQFKNLTALLSYAKGDFIIIVEDDDYYGPQHFTSLLFALNHASLAAEYPTRYYNVKTRTYRVWDNKLHASLCQTGFRKEVIPEVIDICNQEKWIDITLWNTFSGRRLLYEAGNVVGIKGMPGRPGISHAHSGRGVGWRSDLDLVTLAQWIGKDSEVYKPYAVR